MLVVPTTSILAQNKHISLNLLAQVCLPLELLNNDKITVYSLLTQHMNLVSHKQNEYHSDSP